MQVWRTVCVGAAFVAAAFAEQVTWTGAGSNDLWDNPANWSPSKIPQPDDDCTVPAGSSVSIGTPQGANVRSLVISSGSTLKTLGCSLTVGSGGIVLQGTATWTIDAGAGTIASAGSVQARDDTIVTWQSGSISGSWQFARRARFNINGGNQFKCTNGDIRVENLSIGGGVLFNSSCLITATGTVSVSSPTARIATALLHLELDGGSLAIGGSFPVTALYVKAAQVTITAPVYWRPISTGYFSSVSIANEFSIQEPSTMELINVTGTGILETNGPGVTLTLSGPIAFSEMHLQNGQVKCSTGAITTGKVEMISATITLLQQCSLKSATSLSAVGNNFLLGKGAFTTNSAIIDGTITIDQDITIQQTGRFSASLTLNGQLELPPQATLTYVCNPTCPKQYTISPADASFPGVFVGDGEVVIDGTDPLHLVINDITMQGDGSYTLSTETSKLELVKVKLVADTITLGSNSSSLVGESLSIAYRRMNAPLRGQKLGITADGKYEECTSPCPSKPAPPAPYQQFEVIPLA